VTPALKIALVVTNLRGGGAEKAFLKLGALLAGRGHEIHLFLLENIVEHAPAPAIKLHALTDPGQVQGKGFIGKRLAAIKLRKRYRQAEGSRPFDFTLSTLPFADEVVSLAGLPRVWHRIANTLSAEIDNLRRRSTTKAARRLARYRRLYDGKNLIAVSRGVADDLREKLGMSAAHIERIYNPFDLNEIRRRAEEIPPDLPQAPYIVHVGRFAPQKRHDLLFEAWKIAALPHKLVLLTSPNAALNALIVSSGLDGGVIVAGFQHNPYPWMRRAAALVLSSDHEGLPNVLIEALICGAPIVSTDCPSGPREIMTGDLAQFLVPVGDAYALAEALQTVIDCPASASEGQLERFSGEAIARAYESLAKCRRESE